jgi:hypothetical protein
VQSIESRFTKLYNGSISYPLPAGDRIRCTNEVRDGMQSVRLFGVSAAESEFANRFLVQANMALTAGRPLRIQFHSRSWSQPPDLGCDSTDCRAAVAIGMF